MGHVDVVSFGHVLEYGPCQQYGSEGIDGVTVLEYGLKGLEMYETSGKNLKK